MGLREYLINFQLDLSLMQGLIFWTWARCNTKTSRVRSVVQITILHDTTLLQLFCIAKTTNIIIYDCYQCNGLHYGVVFSVTFWIFRCQNPVEKFEVKPWFLLFKVVFWLYIWIQHPVKPLGHLDCGGITHQTCDFNKFLPDFREIRQEKPTEKTSKKSH